MISNMIGQFRHRTRQARSRSLSTIGDMTRPLEKIAIVVIECLWWVVLEYRDIIESSKIPRRDLQP